MAIVVIAPRALLPEALHDIRLVLVVLRVAVLRGIVARDFAIYGIATSFENESTTLEILTCTVLSLVLALRVCAHLLNSYYARW